MGRQEKKVGRVHEMGEREEESVGRRRRLFLLFFFLSDDGVTTVPGGASLAGWDWDCFAVWLGGDMCVTKS